jgi:uncharacterized protein involved in type VI secretion and phage assembly
MAQQVKVHIEIEGNGTLEKYGSLVIRQSLFDHHSFELEVPFEALEKEGEYFFDQSHGKVCGKALTITFSPVFESGDYDFTFKGIVTEIALQSLSDMQNAFVLKGYSTTIVLEDCRKRRTFMKKNIQSIFQEVLKPYPGNVLKNTLKAKHKETIDYAVQYDETNFRFLTRMAAEYGEWCYYNGKELVLGEQSGPKISFKADGKQLFDMSIALHPSKFTAQHYDYLQNKTFEADSSKQKVSGMGKYSDFALDNSDKLFANNSNLITTKPFKDQKSLDDWSKAYQHQEASRLIVFKGKGEKPDMSVGTVIEVTGSMLDGKELKDTSLGKYRVTEVIHEVDSGGNYQCRFSAIPESAGFPPPNPFVSHPVGVAEFAKVIDNNDPEKIGRVKVEFLWKDSYKESDWMRVGMAYAAKDIGMVFIPEKDAQVLVCYEGNSPEMPYVNGSFWPKEGKEFTTDNNDLKGIVTRGGNIIEFLDEKGSETIHIYNKNNKDTFIELSFASPGTIEIKTPGDILLGAGNITIEASQDLTLKGMNIKMEGSAKAEIKTAQLTAEGSATTSIKGTQMDIAGDAVVSIKGALVKIN